MLILIKDLTSWAVFHAVSKHTSKKVLKLIEERWSSRLYTHGLLYRSKVAGTQRIKSWRFINKRKSGWKLFFGIYTNVEKRVGKMLSSMKKLIAESIFINKKIRTAFMLSSISSLKSTKKHHESSAYQIIYKVLLKMICNGLWQTLFHISAFTARKI